MLMYFTAATDSGKDVVPMGEAQDVIHARNTPWVSQLARSTVKLDGKEYPCFEWPYGTVVLGYAHEGGVEFCEELPPPPKLNPVLDKRAVDNTGMTLVSLKAHNDWMKQHEDMMAEKVAGDGG